MVAWLNLRDDEREVIAGLFDESDRAAAIIAASILEDRLERKIKTILRQDERARTTKITGDIFRPSGPLGSFSVKIDFGFMLHLYDEVIHRELSTIKDIRNSFAHKLNVKSFKNQRIKTLCQNLKLMEQYWISPDVTPVTSFFQQEIQNYSEYHEDPKLRYLCSCSLYQRKHPVSAAGTLRPRG